LSEGRLSLFFDYDGTLTGITGRPEEARLSGRTLEALEALSRVYPLAVVSGRALSDIRDRVGIGSIVYAGNHGLQISAPHFSMTYDIGRSRREALLRLRGELMELAEGFEGVIVEDKSVNITVHYRLLAAGAFEGFRESFEEAVVPFLQDGHVRLARSRKAFELRANVRWDKGRTLLWLMDRPLFRGTTPLYMGDDHTDRDAYRAIGADGVSVNVGRPVEDAAYFLETQKEVEPFLKWLATGTRRTDARPVDFSI